MEKPARHQEWARFKIIGRPLLTGTAIGSTPIFWVACRTSPCLVHVYKDGQLQASLYFVEDPIFLLLGPPLKCQLQDDGVSESKTGNKSELSCASLLVITSDGCIWHVPVIDTNEVRDRPAKRYKESLMRELPGGSLENVSLPANVHESSKAIKSKHNEWDLFKDIDIYTGNDSQSVSVGPDGTQDFLCSKEKQNWTVIGKHAKTLPRPLQLSSASVTEKILQSKLHWNYLTVNIRRRSLRGVQAMPVQPESLVGRMPGACLAVFGPEGLVAIVSPDSSPKFYQDSLSATSSALMQSPLEMGAGQSIYPREPTCSLFVSLLKKEKHERPCWEGAFLSQDFYDAISMGLGDSSPHHLLLQGDVNGKVHVFPVLCSKQTYTSHIFCNLQEPIVALLSVPFQKTSDMLLVIGQFGRIIAVAPSRGESTDSSFFVPHFRSETSKLFQVKLEHGFQVRDWRVRAPVTSACMVGSKHLLYCAASEVFISNLFEDAGLGHLQGCESQPHKNLFLVSSSGFLLNKSLISERLPVADIVIAVVGKGASVLAPNARPLVALTAQGRLLGVEISEDVRESGCGSCIVGQNRTWRSGRLKMEEDVKELIDSIAEIGRRSEAVQLNIKYLNLALSELAGGLNLTYEILADKSRADLRKPCQFSSSAPLTGLKCTLEVIPSQLSIPRENLYFGASSCNQPSKDNFRLKENGFDIEFGVHITIFNYTPYPISPYWTLLLKICSSGFQDNTSISFSNVINGGYGLPSGAQCRIDFHGELPRGSQGPFTASIFLCHVHDYHENVLESSLTFDTNDANLLNGIGPKAYLFEKNQSMAKADEVMDGSMKNDGVHLHENKSDSGIDQGSVNSPGAVCLQLAHYRVDILSFLQRPLVKQESIIQKMDSSLLHDINPTKAVAEEDSLFGQLSGRFQLVTRDSPLSSNVAEIMQRWQDYYLEDLIEHGSLSKNGNQLFLCAPSGGAVSFSLEGKPCQVDGFHCKELKFSTSSLLLGCLVREAVLWRMSLREDWPFSTLSRKGFKVDFEDGRKECVEFSKPLGKFNFVCDTIQKVEIIIDDVETLAKQWKSIPSGNSFENIESSEQPLLGHMYMLVTDLLKIYKAYREHPVSDPFTIS